MDNSLWGKVNCVNKELWFNGQKVSIYECFFKVVEVGGGIGYTIL